MSELTQEPESRRRPDLMPQHVFETAMYRAVVANPVDRTGRLVWGDWLEDEHSDVPGAAAVAACIRAMCLRSDREEWRRTTQEAVGYLLPLPANHNKETGSGWLVGDVGMDTVGVSCSQGTAKAPLRAVFAKGLPMQLGAISLFSFGLGVRKFFYAVGKRYPFCRVIADYIPDERFEMLRNVREVRFFWDRFAYPVAEVLRAIDDDAFLFPEGGFVTEVQAQAALGEAAMRYIVMRTENAEKLKGPRRDDASDGGLGVHLTAYAPIMHDPA